MTETEKYLNNLPGLLIFNAGSNQFCIDIKDVTSIIKIDGSEYKIEYSTGHFARVHYADTDYYCYDSQAIFSKSGNLEILGKKAILCTLYGKRIALIADEIVEFLSLDTIFVQKNIAFHESDNNEYIRWKLEYQNRTIYYPDYQKIAKEFSAPGIFQHLFTLDE